MPAVSDAAATVRGLGVEGQPQPQLSLDPLSSAASAMRAPGSTCCESNGMSLFFGGIDDDFALWSGRKKI